MTMTKRMAVISHDLKVTGKLADFLGECSGVKVYKDQDDAMYELLKIDARKYFSPYQLHVLLNRLLHWSNEEDCILCDTLFTDYSATLAALESGMITQSEFEIYEAKQNECMEAFQGYDALIYLKPSNLIINDPITANFPLKYAAYCQKHFTQKLEILETQMKDRFLCINEDDPDCWEKAKNLALHVFGGVPLKEQTKSDKTTKESSMKSPFILQLHQIKEKLPYVDTVGSKDEIIALIKDFQARKTLTVRLPCLYMDDCGCCTCLRIMGDDIDEWIECKEFCDLDEIIAFLKEGVRP